MYAGKNKVGFGKCLAGLAFFFFVFQMTGQEEVKTAGSFGDAVQQEAAAGFADWLCVQFMPAGAAFAGETNAQWLTRSQTECILPLYGAGQRRKVENFPEIQRGEPAEDDLHGEMWDMAESEAENRQEAEVFAHVQEAEGEVMNAEELLELFEAENRTAAAPVPFVPREQRVRLNLEEYAGYEALMKQFYTIDATTMAGTDQFNLESLLEPDLRIEKRTEGPQILIYHTHSQEAFADSVQGDASTSIVGVGERLAEILQEEYGYQVLHHKGEYDTDSRDDAYGKALPDLKAILEENPGIEVVIDLHRDQMPEETRLVMDLDGRPTARFMFFNGLSRTRQSGNIDYLKNDNIAENLAMSFQMQLKCEEYYPGLTRKIYLKGYRYNMHLCPRTLLVELGAQNNTVEEAMNACDPLAHVLDMVLSGE